MTHSWPDVLTALVTRTDLTVEQASWAMGQILAGEATSAQVAGFAIGLRAKGETLAEIDGLLSSMYEHAVPLTIPGRALDIVGTGGDRSNSVNISTMAAIVAAGAGAPVVKHGNRSASSKAGSADVLELLGVRLDLTPEQVEAVFATAGITFAFAPAFHGAMRHTGQARRELGIGTVFNFLGPLANPAGVTRLMIGVADAAMAERMVGVLAARDCERALVVHGDDGLDELTLSTTSTVVELRDGKVETYSIDPTDVGLSRAPSSELTGGDPELNADLARRVLAGEPGPRRDVITLNAAAGLLTAGIVDDLAAGVEVARAAIDGGHAQAALDRLVAVSNAETE